VATVNTVYREFTLPTTDTIIDRSKRPYNMNKLREDKPLQVEMPQPIAFRAGTFAGQTSIANATEFCNAHRIWPAPTAKRWLFYFAGRIPSF